MQGTRTRLLFSIAIIAAATIFITASTWKTWPDAIYDFGSQLYYPWQMNQGKHLYADIAYFNGPLSQYFNAVMFAIFGASLRTLIMVNLAIVLVVIGLIYHLLNQLGGMLAATCGCVVFVTVFAFSQYVGIGNYNWVCPYTHEVTHGVALSLAMIASLGALLKTGRRRWSICSGVLLGLVYLTKAEVFVSAAGAATAGLLFLARGVGRAKAAREVPWFFISATSVVVIAFAIIALSVNASIAVRAIEGSWPWVFDRRIAQLQFYRQGLGIDDPAGNLWKMLVIGCASLAILAGFLAMGLVPKRYRAFTILCVTFEITAMLWFWRWTLQIARPWPVFLVAISVISFIKAWKSKNAAWVLRAVLALFAFGLLGKMLINARIWQYGFALTLPAAMVLIDAVVGWVPNAFTNRTQMRWVGIAVVIATTICLYANQFSTANSVIAVGKDADQFFTGKRGREVVDACISVEKLIPPNGTLAVMPQGLMLNYLTRRADSVTCVNLMPPEVLSMGEDTVVERLNAHPPDLIVLSEKDIRDGSFVLTEGNYHYGQKILASVLIHYSPAVSAAVHSELKLSFWKKRSPG